MKNLISYIKESLLDDEDVLMKDAGDEAVENEILRFLKDNYFNGNKCKISKTPINGKYVVDCSGSLRVKKRSITSLTNEYFEFGIISGNFDCSECKSLTTLKGAPEKVGGDFNCCCCYSLTSIEGALKEVGGLFDCSLCNSLTSLEGAPKEVGGNFYCYDCKSLTSLKGAPKKVDGDFYCSRCKSLTYLKGAPKEVGGNFYCSNCKTQFTTNDVEKVSKVRGEIIC